MCTYCINMMPNNPFQGRNTDKIIDLPNHDVTQEMEQATSSNEIYICKYCLYIEKLMIC